jgi:hypothetical protein
MRKRNEERTMTTQIKTATNYGDLHDYTTGEYIRPATAAERKASDEAGDEGVIRVDGRSCYVDP